MFYINVNSNFIRIFDRISDKPLESSKTKMSSLILLNTINLSRLEQYVSYYRIFNIWNWPDNEYKSQTMANETILSFNEIIGSGLWNLSEYIWLVNSIKSNLIFFFDFFEKFNFDKVTISKINLLEGLLFTISRLSFRGRCLNYYFWLKWWYDINALTFAQPSNRYFAENR